MLNDEKEELLRSIEDLNEQLKSNQTEASLKKKEYMNELKQQVPMICLNITDFLLRYSLVCS